MTATSGRKCSESYAKQSPLGSLVKMLLASSTWHSTRCVLTWKVKVTKSNRSLFQLAVSMPRTRETESGSLDVTQTTMWPSPRACDLEGGVSQASNAGGGWYRENRKGERWGVKLKDAVHSAERMWPTPSSRDGKGGYRGGANEERKNIEGHLGCCGATRGESGQAVWPVEPNVGRLAHGVPNRVAKLRGLGNAIVPQVAAEIIRNINLVMEQSQ